MKYEKMNSRIQRDIEEEDHTVHAAVIRELTRVIGRLQQCGICKEDIIMTVSDICDELLEEEAEEEV
jgi:hypothetical protein